MQAKLALLVNYTQYFKKGRMPFLQRAFQKVEEGQLSHPARPALSSHLNRPRCYKKKTNKKTQLHICALHQHRGINSEQRFMKLNLITCRKGNRSWPRWVSTWKWINAIHHIHKLGKKNNMFTLVHTEKAFHRIQYPFPDSKKKHLIKALGIGRKFFYPSKTYLIPLE